MGARLLPEISKQAARLHRCVVERGELGFRRGTVRERQKVSGAAAISKEKEKGPGLEPGPFRFRIVFARTTLKR
jgi:hypothetical protein